MSCDLLKNQYLCGINNSPMLKRGICFAVVICSKINTFVVSTTVLFSSHPLFRQL